MLVEWTSQEEATLRQLAAERVANGPTVTNSTLQAALMATNASWQSAPNVQAVVFSGTTLSVERLGRFNYVRAKGATQTASITAITAATVVPFSEGDTITIRIYESGWWLRMSIPGLPKSILLHDETHQITLQYIGGAWSAVSSNPPMSQTWSMPPVSQSATSATLAINSDSVSLKYLTAETPATGSVEITTIGAAGPSSVTIYVDEGAGLMLLGTYASASASSVTDVAVGLVAAIAAEYALGNHLYTATNTLGVVDIAIPAGLGASANTYVISTVDTGDWVSVATGYGVGNGGTDGVDGTEADGTIEVIEFPATDGAIVAIINEMTANTISLDGPSVVGSNIGGTKTIEAQGAAMLMYSVALSKWTIIGNEQNGHAYSEIYMQGNATATAVAATNTFYKVAGTTTNAAYSHKFTQGTNRLTYTGELEKLFLVTYQVWFQSTNNDKCTFGIYSNGAMNTASQVYAYGGTRPVNVSGSVIVSLANTGYIEIHGSNNTTVANITVDQLMLNITQI